MILVTGGTGLVGSHLLLSLLQAGNKVKAIHRKNSDLHAVKKVFGYYLPKEEAEFLFGEISWHPATLTDIPALSEAFDGITRVYHCAALVSFNSKDTAALRKINIEGTANIVNFCISHKVEKLCYISSISTMDLSVGERFITEDFTWHPEKDHSEYAISKHGAEIEVWRASQEGVPVVILNPGVILGPGFWDKGTGQIFKKVYEGLNYHFPKITGFVGVRDVSSLAVKVMESAVENEQYIVVAENLSFKEVFDKTAKSFGKKPPQKSLKPWMVYIGWVYQAIASFLFGAKKEISKRDHKSLFEQSYFSNTKVKNEFSYEFTPVNN
ncbi:MAG TPA: NAD-dependent epimerase/dehydratase family protein, partial [Gillisia sp.]|nr:NAD-dependent epimerase/dehydratase family protein [Gillisia sp.]